MNFKKRPKRVLALILTLVIILGSLPESIKRVTADDVPSEEAETVYRLQLKDANDGENITTKDSGVTTVDYRIVTTLGAVEPAEEYYLLSAEVSASGEVSFKVTNGSITNVDDVKGIQMVSLSSTKNYTDKIWGVYNKDDPNTNTNESGFFTLDDLRGETPKTISLTGRPAFSDRLVVVDEENQKVEDGGWRKSVTISGIVKKEDTETDYTKYTVDVYKNGAASNPDTISPNSDNGSFSYAVQGSEEAEYSFKIKKTVDDKDYESKEASVSIKTDNTIPSVDSVTNESGDNWTTSAAISGTVSDVHSGVKNVYYAKDENNDGQPDDDKVCLEEEKGELHRDENGKITGFGFTAKPEEGSTFEGKYLVWCEDNAGNESEKKEVGVKLDGEKPVATISSSPSGWTKDEVTITVSVRDGDENSENEGSGIKEVWLQENETTKEITSLLQEGKYTFTISKTEGFTANYTVWCEDNAGNLSEKETVGVYIDKEKCVLSEVQVNPKTWTNGPVTISGTISDAGSGVNEAKLYYSKADGKEKKLISGVTVSPDKKAINYSFQTGPDDYAGEYYIYADDLVGNG